MECYTNCCSPGSKSSRSPLRTPKSPDQAAPAGRSTARSPRSRTWEHETTRPRCTWGVKRSGTRTASGAAAAVQHPSAECGVGRDGSADLIAELIANALQYSAMLTSLNRPFLGAGSRLEPPPYPSRTHGMEEVRVQFSLAPLPQNPAPTGGFRRSGQRVPVHDFSAVMAHAYRLRRSCQPKKLGIVRATPRAAAGARLVGVVV